jgi:hypothetical protein
MELRIYQGVRAPLSRDVLQFYPIVQVIGCGPVTTNCGEERQAVPGPQESHWQRWSVVV